MAWTDDIIKFYYNNQDVINSSLVGAALGGLGGYVSEQDDDMLSESENRKKKLKTALIGSLLGAGALGGLNYITSTYGQDAPSSSGAVNQEERQAQRDQERQERRTRYAVAGAGIGGAGLGAYGAYKGMTGNFSDTVKGNVSQLNQDINKQVASVKKYFKKSPTEIFGVPSSSGIASFIPGFGGDPLDKAIRSDKPSDWRAIDLNSDPYKSSLTNSQKLYIQNKQGTLPDGLKQVMGSNIDDMARNFGGLPKEDLEDFIALRGSDQHGKAIRKYYKGSQGKNLGKVTLGQRVISGAKGGGIKGLIGSLVGTGIGLGTDYFLHGNN